MWIINRRHVGRCMLAHAFEVYVCSLARVITTSGPFTPPHTSHPHPAAPQHLTTRRLQFGRWCERISSSAAIAEDQERHSGFLYKFYVLPHVVVADDLHSLLRPRFTILFRDALFVTKLSYSSRLTGRLGSAHPLGNGRWNAPCTYFFIQ